jgi:hypothetical protein
MDEPSGSGRIRASDAERERVARFLAAAFTDGRLDLAEYDTRVAAAYAAVYRDELAPLIADLPSPEQPLFDRKQAVSATSKPPAPVQASAPPVPAAAHHVRPYGWPVVLALFGGALCLARVGWFGPMLLILITLVATLSWIFDEPTPRRRRRPR